MARALVYRLEWRCAQLKALAQAARPSKEARMARVTVRAASAAVAGAMLTHTSRAKARPAQ